MPGTNPHHTPTAAACVSPGCSHPAAVTLALAHRSGLRSLTRRCRRCAARLACHHLHRGYTVLLTPDPTPGPTSRHART